MPEAETVYPRYSTVGFPNAHFSTDRAISFSANLLNTSSNFLSCSSLSLPQTKQNVQIDEAVDVSEGVFKHLLPRARTRGQAKG